MTRIVGKIYENTKEIKENNLRGAAAPRRGAAGGSAFVFFIFLSIFVYFANNPSHWDGNPGIGIVNPNNPSQGRSLGIGRVVILGYRGGWGIGEGGGKAKYKNTYKGRFKLRSSK